MPIYLRRLAKDVELIEKDKRAKALLILNILFVSAVNKTLSLRVHSRDLGNSLSKINGLMEGRTIAKRLHSPLFIRWKAPPPFLVVVLRLHPNPLGYNSIFSLSPSCQDRGPCRPGLRQFSVGSNAVATYHHRW